MVILVNLVKKQIYLLLSVPNIVLKMRKIGKQERVLKMEIRVVVVIRIINVSQLIKEGGVPIKMVESLNGLMDRDIF